MWPSCIWPSFFSFCYISPLSLRVVCEWREICWWGGKESSVWGEADEGGDVEERAEARTPHEVPPAQQWQEEGNTNTNLRKKDRRTEGKVSKRKSVFPFCHQGAAQLAKEVTEKLEEAEEQCRDSLQSEWEQCRPCLEDACKTFYTSTCRRGFATFHTKVWKLQLQSPPLIF